MDKQTQQNQQQPQYSFLYLKSPQFQFQRWLNRHTEFLNHGKVEYFAGLLCPVSTADAEVIERTRAEYDTIEFIVLQFYRIGITKASHIAEFTGLETEMIKNVLDILENSYHHIKNGQITEEGLQSLKDEKNIQCFQTTKQVQFECITGTVVLPSLFQTLSSIEAYYFLKDPDSIRRIMPKHYIERDIRNDILKNFEAHKLRGTIERNVEKILDVTVSYCNYTEAFLIKYDFLPHPFLLFAVQGAKNILWMPVAISESTAKEMEKRKLEFGYRNFIPLVRPDSEFKPLTTLENTYSLKQHPDKLPDEFTIKDTTYKVCDKNEPDASLRIHPNNNFTPVYCKIVSEKGGTEDVEM